MHEPEFDPRLIAWLRDGPSGASDWVLEAVVHHARRHPRRQSLLVRWSHAMKAVTVGQPATPTTRLAAVLGAAALLVALAGLLYVGSQNLVTPIPTASPTATARPSYPSAATVQETVDRVIAAWQHGNTAAVGLYYASDYRTHVIGDSRWFVQAEFVNPLTIRSPSPYPWFSLKRAGAVFGDVAYWAHPTLLEWWDPLIGFSVYRFDSEGRIEVEWAVLHDIFQPPDKAVSAPAKVVTFLDGCLEALNARDRTTFLSCFAADAEYRIAYSSPGGLWTNQYVGIDAIAEGFDGIPHGKVTIQRTGEVIEHWIVAYPFRASDGSSTGIDVFELDVDGTRILNRWTFCGP